MKRRDFLKMIPPALAAGPLAMAVAAVRPDELTEYEYGSGIGYSNEIWNARIEYEGSVHSTFYGSNEIWTDGLETMLRSDAITYVWESAQYLRPEWA